jgi:hypothetical protein
VTSDVHEWAPSGLFMVHPVYGKIGDTSVGGVKALGVDDDGYLSTFYDSFGNVHTRVAHHEFTTESGERTPSMDVSLRLVK